MKNKKLTYILIPLVLGLWGTILYKIFHTVNTKSTDLSVNKNIITDNMQTQTVLDTFSIHPVYNDPFLRKKTNNANYQKAQPKPATNISETKKVVKPEVTQPSAITWPGIVYNGLVKNQKSNKLLAMIQVNGQSNIMQTGDVFAELQLVKVTKDSIEILFHSERKTIKKQS